MNNWRFVNSLVWFNIINNINKSSGTFLELELLLYPAVSECEEISFVQCHHHQEKASIQRALFQVPIVSIPRWRRQPVL